MTYVDSAVLYVLACDPLPPCSGKVRVWLLGMTPARDAKETAAP